MGWSQRPLNSSFNILRASLFESPNALMAILCANFAIACVNTTTKEQYDSVSKDERDLSRIVALASGLGLGAMLALSEAVRVNDASASLHFSFRTAIAFMVGFFAAYAYLSRILRSPEHT
jgi:hypothetical protein